MVSTPEKQFNWGWFLGVLEFPLMAADDFFRARLDQMIDLRHALAVLAARVPWRRKRTRWRQCSRTGIARAALSRAGICSAPAWWWPVQA